MEEEKMNEWTIEFLNLPCDEQLYFAQKIALDNQLRTKFNEWLLTKEES